jgi:hypothetical protein
MAPVAHLARQPNEFGIWSRGVRRGDHINGFAFGFPDAAAVGSGAVVVQQGVTALMAEGLQGLRIVDIAADREQVRPASPCAVSEATLDARIPRCTPTTTGSTPFASSGKY